CSDVYAFSAHEDGRWDSVFDYQDALDADLVIMFSAAPATCTQAYINEFMEQILSGDNFILVPIDCVITPNRDNFITAIRLLPDPIPQFRETLHRLSLTRPLPVFNVVKSESAQGLSIKATLQGSNAAIGGQGVHLFYRAAGENVSSQIDYNVTDTQGQLSFS